MIINRILTIGMLCWGGALLITGCDNGNGGRSDDLPDSGPDAAAEPTCTIQGLEGICNNAVSAGQTVYVTSANSYTYQSTLTVQTIPVASSTNLIFDWSQLTQDYLLRPVNPLTDIDMTVLSVWGKSSDQITTEINTDQMNMEGFKVVAESYSNNAATSAAFLDFTVQGADQPDDQMLSFMNYYDSEYDPATIAHLLTVQTGEVLGRGVRMLVYLTLSPDTNAATTVYITNEATKLDFTVDMRSLTRLAVPVGTAGLISVDWVYVTTNPAGFEFFPFGITQAVIAHFPFEDICEVEEYATTLEQVADQWYSTKVTEGTSVSFANLTLKADPTTDPTADPLTADDVGADLPAFQGITDSGVWLLALYCGQCSNPVPKFVTVLHPCAAGV